MSQHYLRKSAFLLSLLAAGAITSQAKADDVVPSNQPSQPVLESTTTTQDSPQVNNSVEATPAASTEAANTTPVETTPTAETTNTASTATPAANPVTAAQTTPSENPNDTKPIEGEKVDVRILSTTDLHTNLVNYDYYQDKAAQNIGFAKTALLIDDAEKENPNTVLVDNGDTIQGTPLGTYEALVNPVKKGEQHPMYKAFTTLNYDAASLGNHEFNYGLDYLNQLINSAGLPIVNSNVIDVKTGKPYFKPYIIVPKTFADTNGRKVTVNIGITGIVPPQIMNWDKANLEGKVTTIDAVQAVEAVAPVMRENGADIVLVLSHSGIGNDKYDVGEENVGYQIASAKGIDAVVTGHSHAEFPSGNGTGFYEKIPGVDGINGKINGIPVTMGGKYGDHLGVIDLNLAYENGKWKVDKSHAEIRKIDTKSDKADPRILAIAEKAHEATIDYVREQVGTTTAPINSYFALVQDDPSVQIVNNAQRWYVKDQLAGTPEGDLPLLSAAAPFKAGARDDASAYTDIPAGPIAIKNVADLYLYDNVTAILKITGKDLREWLEMSAGQFNQIDPNKTTPQQIINTNYRTYNFDVIDGVNYKIDVTQPNKYDIDGNLVNANANRIKDLTYNGQPVKDDQEFIVVTNNYRASGNFPGVKNATVNRLLNLENRQALINYIIAEKTINPSADNNWQFADTIKGLDIHFRTAERAKNLLGTASNIQFIASDPKSEGFGDFKFIYIDPQENNQSSEQAPNASQAQSHKLTPQERQAILELVTSNYERLASTQSTSAPKSNTSSHIQEKSLPKTNAQSSGIFELLGLALVGLAGILTPKSKRD